MVTTEVSTVQNVFDELLMWWVKLPMLCGDSIKKLDSVSVRCYGITNNLY